MNWIKKNIYHNFVLEDHKFCPDIISDGFIFEHKKSGAKLIALKNDDRNKTFGIAFRTIPSDSTGVPHIVEHCVLSGSKKYPLKDVFSEIGKGGSLTFLNAFTGLDITMYPFSTRNEKEYYNIMDIYLDSTLNPLLTKNTFSREAWNYDLKDRSEDLRLNGIVYNEMKGAYSDPYEVLRNDLFKALFPDSSYIHNSGGDPLEIPDLSYEGFIEYHRRHYHPSNSIIYVYGNSNLLKELDFIDKFLCSFDLCENGIKADYGKEIEAPAIVEDTYCIDAFSSLKEKTFFEIASIISDIRDRKTNLCFSLLSRLLHSSNASPLKRAILDAGVCSDFSGYFTTVGKKTVFISSIMGSEKDYKNKINDIYYKTLSKISREGLSKDFILSELNHLEFSIKQHNATALRGLEYGEMLCDLCVHTTDNIFDFLTINPLLKELRRDIMKENLLENLIEKYLINNPKTAIVILSPDINKASRINNTINEKLNKTKASMTEEEIECCIKQAMDLKKESNENETDEQLSILPRLKRNDLKPEINFHRPSLLKLNDIQVLINDIWTNDILYLEFGFKADALTADELKTLHLFGKVLTEMGTKNRSYNELSIQLSEYTGGISTYFKAYKDIDTGSIKPYFWIKLRVLNHYLDKGLEILSDIISNTDFADFKIIKDIIDRIYINSHLEMRSEGDEIPFYRLMSYLGDKGRYIETAGGYTSFEGLKDIRENYEIRKQELRDWFLSIRKKLFNKDNIMMNITSEKDNAEEFIKKADIIMNSLGNEKLASIKPDFQNKYVNEAFLTPADVVFAHLGCNLWKTGLKHSGHLEVLKKYIERDYLYKHIRLIGGAYGSSIRLDIITGDFILGSYRDPNISETYDAFYRLPFDIEKLTFGNELLEQFIVGAYDGFDILLNPDERGSIARDEYLSGITPSYKQNIVNEILSSSLKDLRDLAPYLEKALAESYKSIIGSGENIRKHKDLFDKLILI